MSISEKFRTWEEMDTEDDFIQYLERLVSGDPALSAASTASIRAQGINRPLSRLAHNTDALLDCLVDSRNTVFHPTSTSAETTWNGTNLSFTGAYALTMVNPVEMSTGTLLNFIATATTVAIAANNVAYITVDRDVTTTHSSISIAATWAAFAALVAASSDKLDIQLIAYRPSTGSSIYLFNGTILASGERIRADGFNSVYGADSIQKSSAATSALIYGGGDIKYATGKVLSWSAEMFVHLPGQAGIVSIAAGSWTFTDDDYVLWFDSIDEGVRAASSPVSITVADLEQSQEGTIDIDGFASRVEPIVIGRTLADADSGEVSFVFANGRTVSFDTTIRLDESPVESFSVQVGSAPKEDTTGNVTLQVTGVDGLDISLSGSTTANKTANLTLAPVWHDRFLTRLGAGLNTNDEKVLRVVCDTSNSDGDLYLTHDYIFQVPGYGNSSSTTVSTRFHLVMDGDGVGRDGITLGDGEVAWIVLPERGVSRVEFHFYVGATPSSTVDLINTGVLEDFPDDDPNAYIIAHRPKASEYWAGTSSLYTFLDITCIRDGSSWPLFPAEAYKAILSSQNIAFSTDRDVVLTFGCQAGAPFYTTAGHHYLRASGSSPAFSAHRPGWDYNYVIDSGSVTTPLWVSAAATDAVHAYFTWDPEAADGGHATVTSLSSATDQTHPTDDNQIYIGTFISNGGGTNSAFILWDGTVLHLDGADEVSYYGTTSRLSVPIHDGLVASEDGGSYEPSSANKFITSNELAADSHSLKPTRPTTIPFLNMAAFSAELTASGEITSNSREDLGGIYSILSGFDTIYTDNKGSLDNSNPGDGSQRNDYADGKTAQGGRYIYINGGMAVLGDTFLWDSYGYAIDTTNPTHWVGGDSSDTGSTALEDGVLSDGTCAIEPMESAGWGDITNDGWQSSRFGGHLTGIQASVGSSPYNVNFGRNYIYMRALSDASGNADSVSAELGDDGANTSHVSFRMDAKVSKFPPEYTSYDSTSAYEKERGGQGLRYFGTPFGDDKGWWICIGTCYLFYRQYGSMDDHWETTTIKGSGSGVTQYYQRIFKPNRSTSWEAEKTRVLPFTKSNGRVRFQMPLSINHVAAAAGPLRGTTFDHGVVATSFLSSSSATDEGPNLGPPENTGIDLYSATAPGSSSTNGIGATVGATLNLHHLMPRVPILSVGFRIAGVFTGGGNANHYQLAVKAGHSYDNTGNGHAKFDELSGMMVAAWSWDDADQGCDVEFDFPVAAWATVPVFRTTINDSASVIFDSDPVGHSTDIREFQGIYITGYQENVAAYTYIEADPYSAEEHLNIQIQPSAGSDGYSPDTGDSGDY